MIDGAPSDGEETVAPAGGLGGMARAPLAVGAAISLAVALGGRHVLGLPVLDALLVAVLLVVVPALAFAQHEPLSRMEIERIPLYWGSIVTLWLLGSASWLVGARRGGAAAVGLTPIAPGQLLAWSAGLTAAGLGAMWAFRGLSRALERPDPPLLRHLLPRTRAERGHFVVLSASAGVCEELAYRGYLIGALAPAIGTASAVAVTSVGFGLVHVYQGHLGMVRAATVGFALAVGLLLSGSLWPAVLAHVAVDLIVGIFVGDRLLSHGPANGVDAPDHAG